MAPAVEPAMMERKLLGYTRRGQHCFGDVRSGKYLWPLVLIFCGSHWLVQKEQTVWRADLTVSCESK
jgi:hypothetical protein